MLFVVCFWFCSPPIYVLESYIVPNLRLWFINKVKMSCQTSLIQSNKRHLFGSPFMDKFAVEICSGKLKHIFFRWLLKGYCFTGLPRFPPMSSLLKQKQYCEKSKNKCHLSNHELNFYVRPEKYKQRVFILQALSHGHLCFLMRVYLWVLLLLILGVWFFFGFWVFSLEDTT